MTPAAPESEYLAIPEIARLTNMSEAYWQKQVWLRKISYTKFGASVRIRRSTLDTWLAVREVAQ
jgi:excisionase family DNA binding protein